MFFHVRSKEAADRDDVEPALSRRVECGADQKRSEALAFVIFGHFGVSEGDLPGRQHVGREGEGAVAEVDLEAMAVRVIANGVVAHPALTKLSRTFLRPACSKSISSLLPS